MIVTIAPVVVSEEMLPAGSSVQASAMSPFTSLGMTA